MIKIKNKKEKNKIPYGTIFIFTFIVATGFFMNSCVNNSVEEAQKQQAEISKIYYESVLKPEMCNRECEVFKVYNNITKLDLIKDYNLSCLQIGYLNDHMIMKSKQVSSGEIHGHYSGFLSYGSMSGSIPVWAAEQITTMGGVAKEIRSGNCTTSCDNRVVNEIDYYNADDFINYYVKNCITKNES